MKHNFKKIEPKWQKKWEEQQAFKAVDGIDKPKFYGLVEFPYPSGAGMHVGHITFQKEKNAGIQCTVPHRIRCIRTSY